ncbi:MAG TPA: alpha/beta hydrolase [Leptolyngbyaceae cyanobacterium M33_DOE_097]|uniref:Alpha/beta hydrolase n=1 Tax=Oscillatoriales cyanobacterium SpSt-418 TaxID=2282169 RepID=A0A7C3KG66_9CYAN|nr:alpha/beta hydrolase [Leptolyngbyaceae cyanobacterium M33_DOE_097]
MPSIDVKGVSHDYDLTETPGAPVTLVFVHGWLLSQCYWQPLVQQLTPHYSCLTYDLRGFGRSQPTASSGNSILRGYRLQDYAEDLGLLLEALQIKNAWLVGHSLGGSIALWAASQFPQLVKGVICLNAGGGIYLKEEFERFRSAGQQLVKLRPRWLGYVPLLDVMFARASVTQKIHRKWGKQRLMDFVTAHPDAALGALLESTTEAEVHQLPLVVSQLKQPVYFIAGANDRIMELRYVHHLASFHPSFGECGFNVAEISVCGHLAMLEQTEQVAEIIDRMVAGKFIPEAVDCAD